MQGVIHQIHRKPQTPGERGLPKQLVPEARVLSGGVEGDYNKYRQEKLQGDPDSALLLLPLETLQQLVVEGWTVQPGDLGENVTTRGLPYESFPAGTRLRLGNEVEIEVARACQPCKNLYLLPYVGPQRGPEFLKTMRDRRGWYARVLQSGTIWQGDPIRVLGNDDVP